MDNEVKAISQYTCVSLWPDRRHVNVEGSVRVYKVRERQVRVTMCSRCLDFAVYIAAVPVVRDRMQQAGEDPGWDPLEVGA